MGGVRAKNKQREEDNRMDRRRVVKELKGRDEEKKIREIIGVKGTRKEEGRDRKGKGRDRHHRMEGERRKKKREGKTREKGKGKEKEEEKAGKEMNVGE